jgi:hypothetical protein
MTSYVRGSDNFDSSAAAATFGFGQTWQNMTSARAASTDYTNNTSRPIQVAVTCPAAGSAGSLDLYVSGVVISRFNNANTSAVGTVSAVVPVGATYKIVLGAGAIAFWMELR